MLFLRLDQALELERAARDVRERLVIRYELFNGPKKNEIIKALVLKVCN